MRDRLISATTLVVVYLPRISIKVLARQKKSYGSRPHGATSDEETEDERPSLLNHSHCERPKERERELLFPCERFWRK